MRPAPTLTPAQLALVEAANLPPVQWPARPPASQSFALCEGTPNMAFTTALRNRVSQHLHAQGFQFRMYHTVNGVMLRSEQAMTPAHIQFIQALLGSRYAVRMEAGRTYTSIAISVAEWYTPTDLRNAMERLDYPLRYSRVVKADMATHVVGLLLPHMDGLSTDVKLTIIVEQMEQQLQRAHVRPFVDIVYDSMRGSREVWTMMIRGEWLGESDMQPLFDRSK